MDQHKPTEKQITVTFSSEVTRKILDASKAKLAKSPGSDPEVLFFEELTAAITASKLADIIDSFSTNSKFADVIGKGN